MRVYSSGVIEDSYYDKTENNYCVLLGTGKSSHGVFYRKSIRIEFHKTVQFTFVNSKVRNRCLNNFPLSRIILEMSRKMCFSSAIFEGWFYPLCIVADKIKWGANIFLTTRITCKFHWNRRFIFEWCPLLSMINA